MNIATLAQDLFNGTDTLGATIVLAFTLPGSAGLFTNPIAARRGRSSFATVSGGIERIEAEEVDWIVRYADCVVGTSPNLPVEGCQVFVFPPSSLTPLGPVDQLPGWANGFNPNNSWCSSYNPSLATTQTAAMSVTAGQTLVYEVMAPPYRPCDSARTLMRIHSKLMQVN